MRNKCMPFHEYDINTIKQKFISALDILIQNEKKLIQNDINERTIAHRLAIYLESEFPGYNVDVEYNRNIEIGEHEPKYIWNVKEGFEKAYQRAIEAHSDIKEFIEQITTYPDIIVHERGNNAHNLLVIELKKNNNKSDWEIDKTKLIAFTQQNEGYKYKLGIHLVIYIDREWKNPSYDYYIDGELE